MGSFVVPQNGQKATLEDTATVAMTRISDGSPSTECYLTAVGNYQSAAKIWSLTVIGARDPTPALAAL